MAVPEADKQTACEYLAPIRATIGMSNKAPKKAMKLYSAAACCVVSVASRNAAVDGIGCIAE